MKTVNWHPDRLQARGRLNMDVRTRSVALIGAGALAPLWQNYWPVAECQKCSLSIMTSLRPATLFAIC
jgi:hypothetical protein